MDGQDSWLCSHMMGWVPSSAKHTRAHNWCPEVDCGSSFSLESSLNLKKKVFLVAVGLFGELRVSHVLGRHSTT
jgi:hypothetical protein